MLALGINNLEKKYRNGVHALSNVSLDIAKGDFFGLLGPNGAGKSTLIGIVSGLVTKTSGTVSVAGRDIDREPERAKTFIGMMPQEINLNIFEKCEDILIQQAGYYGIPKVHARVQAQKYLTQLGLWEKRNVPSMQLSGGMKRRLMIARALIHDPEVIILDEPTAGVDIELRRGMWEFLRELSAGGKTVILTTHYLEEAEQLCKNIAIIDHGTIITQGSVRGLLEKLPSETFVLDAAGDVSDSALETLKNFMPVRIDSRSFEVSLTPAQSVNDVFEILSGNGVRIASMRPKANRLEELFVTLTRK